MGELDAELAKKGEEIYVFKMYCLSCAGRRETWARTHMGLFKRRTPEWIMNMILNPEEMAKNDPIGRGLLMKYNTVMANQGLNGGGCPSSTGILSEHCNNNT